MSTPAEDNSDTERRITTDRSVSPTERWLQNIPTPLLQYTHEELAELEHFKETFDAWEARGHSVSPLRFDHWTRIGTPNEDNAYPARTHATWSYEAPVSAHATGGTETTANTYVTARTYATGSREAPASTHAAASEPPYVRRRSLRDVPTAIPCPASTHATDGNEAPTITEARAHATGGTETTANTYATARTRATWSNEALTIASATGSADGTAITHATWSAKAPTSTHATGSREASAITAATASTHAPWSNEAPTIASATWSNEHTGSTQATAGAETTGSTHATTSEPLNARRRSLLDAECTPLSQNQRNFVPSRGPSSTFEQEPLVPHIGYLRMSGGTATLAPTVQRSSSRTPPSTHDGYLRMSGSAATVAPTVQQSSSRTPPSTHDGYLRMSGSAATVAPGQINDSAAHMSPQESKTNARDAPMFPCSACQRMFPTRELKLAHVKHAHHTKCPICEKLLSRKSKLYRHINNTHSREEVEAHTSYVRCEQCGRFFDPVSDPGGKRHNGHHHAQSTTPPKQKHSRVCPICGKKYEYTSTLRNHMNTGHSRAEILGQTSLTACGLCGLFVNGPSGMRVHMFRAHREESDESKARLSFSLPENRSQIAPSSITPQEALHRPDATRVVGGARELHQHGATGVVSGVSALHQNMPFPLLNNRSHIATSSITSQEVLHRADTTRLVGVARELHQHGATGVVDGVSALHQGVQFSLPANRLQIVHARSGHGANTSLLMPPHDAFHQHGVTRLVDGTSALHRTVSFHRPDATRFVDGARGLQQHGAAGVADGLSTLHQGVRFSLPANRLQMVHSRSDHGANTSLLMPPHDAFHQHGVTRLVNGASELHRTLSFHRPDATRLADGVSALHRTVSFHRPDATRFVDGARGLQQHGAAGVADGLSTLHQSVQFSLPENRSQIVHTRSDHGPNSPVLMPPHDAFHQHGVTRLVDGVSALHRTVSFHRPDATRFVDGARGLQQYDAAGVVGGASTLPRAVSLAPHETPHRHGTTRLVNGTDGRQAVGAAQASHSTQADAAAATYFGSFGDPAKVVYY